MTTKIFEDCVLQSMRFPQKLWQIVNECKTGAIQWGANGSTILLDYKRFQAEYLDARRPIFKTSNITSFIRQLNLYGFRKVTFHDRDSICKSYNPYVHEFVHDNFRADRIDLLSMVCRKTGAKGKYLHDVVKSTEDGPRKENSNANSVSRLKLCQVHPLNVNCGIKEQSIYSHVKKFYMIFVSETAVKTATNLNMIQSSINHLIN